MNLEQILNSLPNGFHDSKLLQLVIDWRSKVLKLELSVWIDEGPQVQGSFQENYRIGTLELRGLHFIHISPEGFKSFSSSTQGAWIDIGCDFSNVKVTLPFSVTASSGWIYFNDYNGFLFFDADSADFSWSKP